MLSANPVIPVHSFGEHEDSSFFVFFERLFFSGMIHQQLTRMITIYAAIGQKPPKAAARK